MACLSKSDLVWERRQKFLRAYRVFGTYRRVAKWRGLHNATCRQHILIARRDNPYPPSWPDPWTTEDAEELANIAGAFSAVQRIVFFLEDQPSSANAIFSEMITTTLRNHPNPDDPPSALYAWMKRGRAA